MKPLKFKNLFQKLSNLGLESFENLTKGIKGSGSENIGGLCNALLQLKGEASSITLAEEILRIYQHSTNEEKLEFFSFINESFSADKEKLDKIIQQYQEAPSDELIGELNKASEAPRLELFRSLNMADNGTQLLIRMREDLMGFLRENPELAPINNDLLHLFRSWFNRGFLEIRRIDWQTPAVILEKLIEYESVHEINGWPDLRRRLEEDRRCFGFFHPVMPLEPLIFVEVALTTEINRDVSSLIKIEKPEDIESEKLNTAVFYSINNCQQGLRGVSFGNLLIKQVVNQLEKENANIKTYVTLSPIPRFMDWLEKNIEDLSFISDEERESLKSVCNDPNADLLEQLELEKTMLNVCAYYLVKAKSRGQPACPVERFLLGNGATLEHINWMADKSVNGLQQSAGLMVNYLYDKSTLAQNHEKFTQEDIVVYSNDVKNLLPSEK